MVRTLLSAMLLALAACTAEETGGNYLGGSNSPVGAGGIGASGQGGAAGTAPFGGGGQLGGAGTMSTGGTGGQLGASGIGASGMGGLSGAGGMAAGGAGAGASGMGGASAGTGGGAGTPPVGGMGGGNSMGTVTVQLTTVTYGGEYAPLNYGAVWFENASGTFIKTAKRWAGTVHASDLVAWTEASGGWGSIFGGGNTADMMDAISSATIRTHQMHTVMWDMMNVEGELVPDGDYVAVLEMSESRARDRAGPILRIPFTKGPSPQTVMPPAQEGFTGVSLTYAP